MSGRQLRDDAFEKVWREAWMRAALSRVALLPDDWVGTGEDIRFILMGSMGLVPPHHPNAWGALINHCLRTGLLEKMKERRNMRDPSSHARETSVYGKL